MRRCTWLSLIVLWGIILLLLVGCGPQAPAAPARESASSSTGVTSLHPTPAPPSLMAVDWANFTYFSSCYGNTKPFHTKNGQAVNNGVHFEVYAPKYGDLTNDGQPEAIIPYQCTAADAGGVHVFVYTGSAVHPVLLGTLPLPNPKGTIANVTGISIANEILYLSGAGYSPDAPHCCPDLSIKTSYRWNGKAFVVVQSTVSKQ